MTEPGSPDDDALLRFLAQFGITPGADGQLDPAQLMARMQQLMTSFSTQLAGFGSADPASGMSWGFARDIAVRTASSLGPDLSPDPPLVNRLRDAVDLADLWLDEEIAFPRLSSAATAWTRQEWVERTFSAWQELLRPVVTQLSRALRELVDAEVPGLEQMLRLSVAGMFAGQVGQALGQLSGQVVSAGDVGLPLTQRPLVAILPANLAAFGDGLEQSESDLLLYWAIRETARQRLFGTVTWLGPQLLALVDHYAREISIDGEALEQAIESRLGSVSTAEELEAAGNALAGSLFAPLTTETQREVLGRLETLLALIEGWVDEVVAQVAGSRMPAATPLTETLRRRRAAGGPAESALKTLFGLELRPRRTRDAANLWAALRTNRGSAARDAVWQHPDLLPGAADLDDPLGFQASAAASDSLDEELARLLDESEGQD